jgi:hypothetical protein
LAENLTGNAIKRLGLSLRGAKRRSNPLLGMQKAGLLRFARNDGSILLAVF